MSKIVGLILFLGICLFSDENLNSISENDKILFKNNDILITLDEVEILGKLAKIKTQTEAKERLKELLSILKDRQHYPEAKNDVERTTMMFVNGPDKHVKPYKSKKVNKYYATKLVLNIKAINQTKIISFNTHENYVSEDIVTLESGLVKSKIYSHDLLNSMIQLTDEYNNIIKIKQLEPKFIETKLRPNDEKKLTIVSDEYPIESSKYLTLIFPNGVFGNSEEIKMRISTIN